MPYIENKKRPEYDPNINMIVDAISYWINDDRDLPGTWNYIMTEIILRSMKKVCGENPRYYVWSWLEGVCGHIPKEVYRRIVGDYEDECIKKNYDTKGYRGFLEKDD